VDIQQLINSKEAFYGVTLDPEDPYLERNLARLEMRFEERYECSLKKETERKEQGKPAHKTILRSMEENRSRLEAVRQLRELFAQINAQ
jgi:hypothetical protein